MHAPRFTYTISRELLPLVRAGKLVLNARASRLTWPDGRFAAPLIPGRDLTMALTRAPVGATIEALQQAVSSVESIAPALEALQLVSAIGAAASVANLAVSIAGFAAVLHRLERIEGKLDAMLATLRSDLADLSSKLDDVQMATLLAGRDHLDRSLAASTDAERVEAARRARDRFLDCRMASLAVWRRLTPWMNPDVDVGTSLELQGRYVASAIGELQAAFILGDTGAFRHTAQSAAADVRKVMSLDPVAALRVRTDAAVKGLSKDNFQALAGQVIGIPSLGRQLGAAVASTRASADRLAAFEEDADLPELMGAPAHEILRAMRDAPGTDVYALGLRLEEQAG